MAVELNSIVSVNLSLKLNPSTKHGKNPLQFLKPQTKLFLKFNFCKCSVLDEQIISFSDSETQLIDALIGIQGRGKSASSQQLLEVERAVKVLEGLEGVPEPTNSNLIEGCWQLMFTTRPGTASPIQRTFVGVDFFSVFQEVFLQTNDQRVSNIVRFSDAIGELKVEAAASIENGKRINFRFDKAAFAFNFLPFKVPYPVPFRLLGDEAKAQGTTFVLQKKTEPRQRLLTAISTGTKVQEAIDEFLLLNQNIAKSELELEEGEWQMIWSSQMETDSWIENAANGLMGKQIVKRNGQMKFVVDILFGIRFSMTGTFQKCGTNKYDVTMDDAAIIAGPYGYPFEMVTKILLQLLYTDEKIRISKGYNGIVFVHIRTDSTKQK